MIKVSNKYAEGVCLHCREVRTPSVTVCWRCGKPYPIVSDVEPQKVQAVVKKLLNKEGE